MKEPLDDKKGKDNPDTTWEYIKTYFPDIWQYLLLILIIGLAAFFIL